jgi:molybdopterin-containing oxidoreductase family iron-sulfur binding subunit
MVIDLNKCTGCMACVVACKSENNLQTEPPDQAQLGRANNWIRVQRVAEGRHPHAKVRFLPLLCNHCDNAPCTKVCPVRATYINEEGLVAQVYGRCIGCRYCACACPYSAKTFNWYTPEFVDSYRPTLNPDVSVRPKGVVEKCTFCHHRLQKAREVAKGEKRQVTEQDYQPACVEICPTRALTFGNLQDKDGLAHRLAQSDHTFRLLEDLGTEPKVTYIAEGKWHG